MHASQNASLCFISVLANMSRWWLVLLLGFLLAVPTGRGEDADGRVKTVEVSGAGTDVESAERDACREAVRQVVGAYVNAETRTENDELIEDKVISLSSGFVEKSETLKKSAADGLVKVRIRATVRISKVIESLKANKISVADIDGQSLGAELLTKTDQRKGEADLIAAAFEGFPARWFKASIDGKPRLGDRNGNDDVPVIVTVQVEGDMEAFAASVAKLDEALKAGERPRGEFDVDGAKCGFSNYWSPERASDRLRYELGDGMHRDSLQSAKAIFFLDADQAFPEEIRRFASAGTASGPKRIMEPGFLPVLFPVKFYGGGRRSSWRWYGMKFTDAQKSLASQIGKSLVCRTQLLDGEGQAIAVDAWEIDTLGIGGMKYWEGYGLEQDGLRAVVIAPASVPHRGVSYLFPKFSCEEEVRKLSKVSVELR